MAAVPIPLARCADELLGTLAQATGSAALAALEAQTLLGERAMLANAKIPALISAGGGCRLLPARDDMIALNLSRPDDRDLLPALFESDALDPTDDDGLAAEIACAAAAPLVLRARTLGMAIAAEHEPTPYVKPCIELVSGAPARGRTRTAPRIVDLSALWAGPLAAHLLWLAGAEVVKVENRNRPDAMRDTKDFYALINQGKASVALNFSDANDLRALLALLASADIVIEAARPRALKQLGIDAEAIVRNSPGLAWLTITAHGATGNAANWVGFGDDGGVAGGLSAALHAATGRTGFVGDAIADPLTGIVAALTAWQSWQSQHGGRFDIAMSRVVAHCIALARQRDAERFEGELRAWALAVGQSFPDVPRRRIGSAASFGQHTQYYLSQTIHR